MDLRTHGMTGAGFYFGLGDAFFGLQTGTEKKLSPRHEKNFPGGKKTFAAEKKLCPGGKKTLRAGKKRSLRQKPKK